VTTPFVNALRTRGEPFKLGAQGSKDSVLQVRAQVLEAWDAITIDADPAASVRSLKQLALRELYPESKREDDFMVKLHGYEILDEDAPISATGARTGSTFLVTDRRRRPVE
jgi:hypothetical protein